MPQAVTDRIGPAVERLLKLLQASAAARSSGNYELKVVVSDGAIKAAFVRSDEPVALKN